MTFFAASESVTKLFRPSTMNVLKSSSNAARKPLDANCTSIDKSDLVSLDSNIADNMSCISINSGTSKLLEIDSSNVASHVRDNSVASHLTSFIVPSESMIDENKKDKQDVLELRQKCKGK